MYLELKYFGGLILDTNVVHFFYEKKGYKNNKKIWKIL